MIYRLMDKTDGTLLEQTYKTLDEALEVKYRLGSHLVVWADLQ